MYRCAACGLEWQSETTEHNCYGYHPPVESHVANAIVTNKNLDRIIRLLEAKNTFSEEVLMPYLGRIVRLMEENFPGAMQARPPMSELPHYPLMGDPPPPPPPGVVTVNPEWAGRHVETDFGQTVDGLQRGETFSAGPDQERTSKTDDAETFTSEQIINAIDQFLCFGESNSMGYFSISHHGWAARCLRFHLDQITKHQKGENKNG